MYLLNATTTYERISILKLICCKMEFIIERTCAELVERWW